MTQWHDLENLNLALFVTFTFLHFKKPSSLVIFRKKHSKFCTPNIDTHQSHGKLHIRQNYNFDMLVTIWHEIEVDLSSDDLRNMVTKLFLFWFPYQSRIIGWIVLWLQQTRTGKNEEKNHKSTNNAMSNDGSSIEIIDRSHGD